MDHLTKKERVFFLVILIITLIFLGRTVNPLTKVMFEFHDITQVARVQQFTLNLKNLKLPPRLAPDFSYKMGYPVFNFYSPFSYWVTSGINLLGFDVVSSLKLSFLLSLTLVFVFTFLFLRCFFDYYPSLFGGILYITSLYFPVDIFVRGNLGESWFLTLFPLSLYLLMRNSKKTGHFLFLATVFSLSASYTVHNLLSVIFIPVSVMFVLLLKNKKINFIAIIFAFFLASYFLLPMLVELPLVYGKEIAAQTDYKLHFLCPSQLWQSNWGYGGSIAGCNDGMSFKLGKLQIISFLLGTVLFIINALKKSKEKNHPVITFFILLTTLSLFLTTYQSRFLWNWLQPYLSVIQFPWRFISFSLIGLVFVGSYFFQKIKIKMKNFILLGLVFFLLFLNSKYFSGKSLTKTDFEKKYLSSEFIEKSVTYRIPEYLPKTADYQAWRAGVDFNYLLPVETREINYQLIKNGPFEKEIKTSPGRIKINLHYFPFWNININGKTIIPKTFDQFGRPIFELSQAAVIKISYRQTLVENVGNFLTLLTLISLVMAVGNKSIWRKLTS